jgi:hypothetical protein
MITESAKIIEALNIFKNPKDLLGFPLITIKPCHSSQEDQWDHRKIHRNKGSSQSMSGSSLTFNGSCLLIYRLTQIDDIHRVWKTVTIDCHNDCGEVVDELIDFRFDLLSAYFVL